MSLVLCAVKNCSDSKSTAFVAWVFEGTAHVGDELDYLVISETTNFGYNHRAEDYKINEDILESRAIKISISRIRKYCDFGEISEGFTALFNVSAREGDLGAFSILMQDNLIPRIPVEERPTKENPKSYRKIYLFNSKESAEKYFKQQRTVND